MSVNRVMILGFCGQDPQVRHLDGGQTVCNFSIATDESYKDKNGEKVKQTEWHSVSIFGKLADFAEMWIKKGVQVYVEGKIKSREYEDKSGVKRKVTEILADKLTMVTWPEGEPASENQSRSNAPQNSSTGVYDQNSRGDGPSKSQPAYQKEEDSDLPF
jgi:single-strand DNA-binding protein